MTEDSTRYFEDRDRKREVFPCIINSIAPIEHENRAKIIAYEHMAGFEQNLSVIIGEMMPTYLAPVGQSTPTHVFCSRDGFCHQVRMLEKHIAIRPEEWVSKKILTINDGKEAILRSMCVVVGDAKSLLKFLGLVEVKRA